MSKIAYLDIEVIVNSSKIDKLGILVGDVEKSTTSITVIKDILDKTKPQFICGHNFIDHDKKFLSDTFINPILQNTNIIDTLLLSMLLYVNKKTHKLDKPYKTEVNIENQPLGDAKQTEGLLHLLDKKYDSLDEDIKEVFTTLLYESEYFNGYFKYKNIQNLKVDIYNILKDKIKCSKKDFYSLENESPIELAFVISYLYSDRNASISYVILKRYPKVVTILKKLTFNDEKYDLEGFAIQEFDMPSTFEFNKFDKEDSKEKKKKFNLFFTNKNDEDNEKISQKDIILNSLDADSILAILPTGGGKTLTFQLPALLKAKAYKGLTVVISPLQALMKNHVDSFKEKNQNFSVVAVSGYLSPIERMDILTKVENGVVDILYIAPEALRSNSVFKTLQKRIIDRFVIDEAHCFSSWGHDFRHDYYFVANSIKELEKVSEFQPKIPVSCFTATAKPEVLQDIKKYFQDNLEVELKEFIASSQRYNLEYKAIEVSSKKEKYENLIKELIKSGKKPTIIYIPQNARECKELSEELQKDERLYDLSLEIEPFYAKIDEEIEKGKRVGRNKAQILNDFINNKIDVVIATTAFGMGIDKPDIQTVIHYEQSDSLESYLQESGRGARNPKLKAQCIVLYSKDDFNRTFAQLTNSKLEYHEIERVIRELKIKFKNTSKKDIYLSPKQIAQKMGIDTEDSSIDYDSMIKTALLELEQAGIIQRGRNSYKIFATSIDKEKRTMDYVHQVLDNKKDEYEDIYEYMISVMQNIIQKSKVDAIEVEELADRAGIEKKLIFDVLYGLQKEGLLEYDNDISVYVKRSILKDFEKHFEIEELIFQKFEDLSSYEKKLNLRDLNEIVNDKNSIVTIKKIIQSWTHLSKLKANIFNAYFYKNVCSFELEQKDIKKLKSLIDIRKRTCEFIVKSMIKELGEKDEDEVEISTNKLKSEFDHIKKLSLEGFHHSLVYLHELINKSFNLRRGRLIYYQSFKIDKQDTIEENTPYQKRKHYNKSLKPYYVRKIESIHIQISFLERLIKDGWEKTSKFVKDYFSMEYTSFKKKYDFVQNNIELPVTQDRLKEILHNLNDEQKQIFDNKKSESIMVLAGPGSGKTKVLVHKIASLVTIENNKAEYFLMLAHSRVAVAEFTYRLEKLIGSQIYNMKIYTFHSFAIELLGKNIDNNKDRLKNVIVQATNMIRNGEINIPYIQMLVLDEYQDVGKDTYEFIKSIYSQMSKDKKIIAVGDDDQCINDFGNDKSDIRFIREYRRDFETVKKREIGLTSIEDSNFSEYSLLTNYRSKKNIIEFANNYSSILQNKLKNKPLLSATEKNGYISLTKYTHSSYIENVVKQIKEDESESVALLCRNNDEVLTVYSQLVANDINAKYITQKDGFRLKNLVELEDFASFWQESDFEGANQKFEQIYKQSKNYMLASRVISRFINEYEDKRDITKGYIVNLFLEYLQEVTFEEFESTKTDVIVSTMHKAKGKEFDSVYVCIDEKFEIGEYDKRLLYVAITRAKNRLSIHSKHNILDFLKPYCDELKDYELNDLEPRRIVFDMSLGDVALSDFNSDKGVNITKPLAGEKANIVQHSMNFFIYKENQQIVKLSGVDIKKPDRLSSKIMQKFQSGYILESEVDIENIVIFRDKNDKIFKEVLCRVYMQRKFDI